VSRAAGNAPERRDRPGADVEFAAIEHRVTPPAMFSAGRPRFFIPLAERRYREAASAQAQFDEYVRTAAGSGGAASEIVKAKQLLDDGTISQVEFDALKTKALS
jgi:hypothetical protein